MSDTASLQRVANSALCRCSRDESKGKRADVDEIDRQELYIENGVLTMISAWLEPLPDKSLPAVQIRTAMLEALYDVCDMRPQWLSEKEGGMLSLLSARVAVFPLVFARSLCRPGSTVLCTGPPQPATA